MRPRAFRWSIEEAQSTTTIRLQGALDENVVHDELAQTITQPVVFDLEELGTINSVGVREWVQFVDRIADFGPHELVRCSPAFVFQLNLIYNFLGNARVQSVIAPYVCDSCKIERNIEVDTRAGSNTVLPKLACKTCDGPLSFDGIESRYFLFLRRGQ